MSRLSDLLSKLPWPRTVPDNDPASKNHLFMERRTSALKRIECYGMHAHYYIPTIKIDDQELANACRFLASSGYIITDDSGNFVGKIARVEHGSGVLSFINSPRFKIRIAK